ncbi:MAG: hypothetical protein ABL903_07280 [Methylococcales bacterium]
MKPPFSDLPLGKLNNISAAITFILSVPALSLAFSAAAWAVEKTAGPAETKSKVENTEKISKKPRPGMIRFLNWVK